MRLRTRATAANATTTPTFSPSTLTARVIKKLNGQALVPGDIAGDEHDLDLTYVATGTYWNLNNPATTPSGVAGSFTSLAASTTFTLSGDLTPAQITANQNDYAPTGHGTASIFRLDTNNLWNITGLQGGADGRIVIFFNIGSNVIGIPHDSASSTAGNRFYIPDSVTDTFELLPNCTAILIYDSTSSRWRLSPLPAPATAARMETASSYGCYVTPFYQPERRRFRPHTT